MKNFVLVMVFVLLMALFIAFNYLLWDRESKITELKNLEIANVSNKASISAQNRDIGNLEEENNALTSEIKKLEGEKTLLENEISLKDNDISTWQIKAGDYLQIISFLKSNADIKLFVKPVQMWVDAINSGKYEDAYRLEFANVDIADKNISIEEYSENLKNSIKSIKIKAVSLDDDKGNEEIAVIKVLLEVKLLEGVDASGSRFVNGENEITCILDYDKASDSIYIKDIS